MKRQLISLMIILPLLSLFSSLEIYAQSGTGDLPGTRPAPTPTTTKTTSGRGSKPGPNTPVILTLNVGEERRGKLEPSNKGPDGSFFEEMILYAKAEDWLTFHIEG